MAHGRHRHGRPGLTQWDTGPSKPDHRARHRRTRTAWQLTAETVGIVAGLGVTAVIAVSGWYTAAGATAIAQMLTR